MRIDAVEKETDAMTSSRGDSKRLRQVMIMRVKMLIAKLCDLTQFTRTH